MLGRLFGTLEIITVISESATPEKRNLREVSLNADLVVIGGGMAGVCCAITAAREGLEVTLVQDRPVLGGNASSEIRLWILGATSSMGNNNRWAREGGVIDEILLENIYRNPEGNALILDTVILEKVVVEKNITLLLNTAVYDVEKKGENVIHSVSAFCSQNSTVYRLNSKLFVDASGDGIVGYLSGAAYRIGAETKEEFDEAFAPDKSYGELLGHSIYFHSKKTDKPVRFIPPSFANPDIANLPRFRSFNLRDRGCRLWWVEYGGRLDTIHDSEQIKWELWRIIYGIWDHIKNSGEYPEAENDTLEWVGMIPGKRESRRFEGDYMLSQKDVVEQRDHADVVSYGGWALDLHPADGVYGEKPGCTQWHSKGIYQIPFRTMYSRNIKNLFLAGRIISASHVAFGSSRVMATCAHNAQAVAMAAVLCTHSNLFPRDLLAVDRMSKFQQKLQATGQYLPKVPWRDPDNLVKTAQITASSTFDLSQLPADGPWRQLDFGMAQLMPLAAGEIPALKIRIRASEPTVIKLMLQIAVREGNFTPDRILSEKEVAVTTGEQDLWLSFEGELKSPSYAFFSLMANDKIEVASSNTRISGIMPVFNKFNRDVAVSARQNPPDGLGIDSFEFWLPERRPGGQNLAFASYRPFSAFSTDFLTNGYFRPTTQTNAWVGALEDSNPSLTISWKEVQQIRCIVLWFDTDADHPLESTLRGHDERVMPGCVQAYRIWDGNGVLVYEEKDNHQTRNEIVLKEVIETQSLRIELTHPQKSIPAGLFGVGVYPY
ncbi:FAD-dependent oxidoreductase [Lunatibacter salilacus]|uniref:FAD-dependent oxidoreductase n=1 Tax=Lunatibacter salilacus TaxID=2483804 RepID=UPI00131E8DE7|nr:FAD-dependent oxidoreductase [Lunatibacter salilacus]